jgi:glycosyltransferase involved in cell wall biosynthesis
MRIAWLGAIPSEEGGVQYAATQMLRGAARAGVEIDCYLALSESSRPSPLLDVSGLRFYREQTNWDWGRWYSRTPLSSFVTGQTAQAMAQRHLAPRVARNHAIRPYDALVQFSQLELFSVRPLANQLPPIVLYPSVHAAGELRWHRREAYLARTCEPVLWHHVARAMLAARSRRQRRDIRVADLVIALSRRFGELLCRDYGISPERVRVVPYPIDLDRFAPGSLQETVPSEPRTILFISRMSVRKGVEMVVALSHRLSDLSGQVRIKAFGGETLWSRYTPLLDGLNPEVASYRGPVDNTELAELYRHADLLVQPSHYEPFALTVAEALASGLPVVASDEVGAAEDVDRRCCSVFPAGDLDAFEQAVRSLVARLQTPARGAIKTLARSEAERLYAPPSVAAQLVAHLAELGSATSLKDLEAVVA